MKHRFLMPPIPDSERTPLVIALLGQIPTEVRNVPQELAANEFA